MNGLKWFAIILLGLTGVVGLGMSLCGGVFFVSSLGKPFAQNYGVGWIGLISLVIGVPIMLASFWQMRRLYKAQESLDAALPARVKHTAILTGVVLLLDGLWFCLPLLVSFLMRRPWSRWAVIVTVALKWLYMGTMLISVFGRSPLLGVSAYFVVVAALDVWMLAWLFSGSVTDWLASSGEKGVDKNESRTESL